MIENFLKFDIKIYIRYKIIQNKEEIEIILLWKIWEINGI